MSAETDTIRTIRESRELVVDAVDSETPEDGQKMMVASGRLRDFSACYGRVSTGVDGHVSIDSKAASMLEIGSGSTLLAMGR